VGAQRKEQHGSKQQVEDDSHGVIDEGTKEKKESNGEKEIIHRYRQQGPPFAP
jgi:hypothetical protein